MVMTTTLGLTRSATCSVVRLLPLVEAEVMELSGCRITAGRRGRCHLLDDHLAAAAVGRPTKPPAKPMAAASTSATALRATRLPLNFFGAF